MIAPVTTADLEAIASDFDHVSLQAGQWTYSEVCKSVSQNPVLGYFVEEPDNSRRLEAIMVYQDLGSELEILWIWTPPRLRGQGRAAALLEYLQNQARESRQKIWLETHESNAGANRLYLRAGFTQVGTRAAYYSDGGAAILYEFAGLPRDR